MTGFFDGLDLDAEPDDEPETDDTLKQNDCDDLDDDEFDDDGQELTPEQVAEYLAQRAAKSFEPKPYKLKTSGKILAVIDTETDPFAFGQTVAPFCLGFYDGVRRLEFWGDDCIKQFFEWLAVETAAGIEYLIYAHNGGKFDFYFCMKYFDPGRLPLIMSGRFVKIEMQGQEFRDSFAIIPQGLGSYQKDKIEYEKFTREKREKHRKEILEYLASDCAYLYDLVSGFHRVFGDRLTIASAALPMLHSMHGFQRFSSDVQDLTFRNYYYGGRVQCFKRGILKGDWKVYDRNSMYPAVMRDCLHPISNEFELQTTITDQTDFACIVAKNYNCLPTRGEGEELGLDFSREYGTFFATIHEINAGLETGTLEIIRVKHAWAAKRKSSFEEFVNRFYGLRLEAKSVSDKVLDILYKLVLNSAYGKFALNPRKFKQWTFTLGDTPEPLASADNPDGWALHSQTGELFIWSRPTPFKRGFYNVATAASITGAARANLHMNLQRSKNAIYCDTDSIICEQFGGDLDETALGGWKLEASGTMAAIAGKKMYAVFNGDDCIKTATKGCSLTPGEVIRLCQGDTIEYNQPAPVFNLDGSQTMLTRNIRMT